MCPDTASEHLRVLCVAFVTTATTGTRVPYAVLGTLARLPVCFGLPPSAAERRRPGATVAPSGLDGSATDRATVDRGSAPLSIEA